MRTSVVLLRLTFAFALMPGTCGGVSNAYADTSAHALFRVNAGGVWVGRNDARGTPCAIEFVAHSDAYESYTLRFRWDSASLQGPAGRAAPSQFDRPVQAERLIARKGGGIGCFLWGPCAKSTLEIDYDAQTLRPTSLTSTDSGRRVETCILG